MSSTSQTRTRQTSRSERISSRAQRTMRAAVLAAPGRLEIADVALPEPGAGQIRLRLEGCGVCASNVPVWEGRPWFDYPLPPGAPGHEGWGVVDAVGPEVTALDVGDRVAALCYRAFAEYDLAQADACLKLPAELGKEAFLGEPLGCAMNVFRRSDIRAGQNVAVVGVGFLGALVIQLARNAGARVTALSRRPFSRQLALQFGADEVHTLDDCAELVEPVRQSDGRQGFDCVIEATGVADALALAAELTRVRGKLVIAGYHQDGARPINLQLWNWRGLDVINAHERDPAVYHEGMQLALNEMLAGRLDPAPLYTHTFPFEQLDDALEAQRERPDGVLKAIIMINKT